VARDHEGQPRAEEVVAKAKDMLAELGIAVAATAVGVGDPVEQIVEAGAGHGVIVVSDSGTSRLKRLLVGSVGRSDPRPWRRSDRRPRTRGTLTFSENLLNTAYVLHSFGAT
jgi:hypothetical protein